MNLEKLNSSGEMKIFVKASPSHARPFFTLTAHFNALCLSNFPDAGNIFLERGGGVVFSDLTTQSQKPFRR